MDQSPQNWTLASAAGPLTTELVDLIDESGQATGIDLTIAATGFSPINVGEASNVPMHPNPLERVAGIWYGTSTATMTWSDLVPGADYNLWIMGAEWFGSSSFGQIVTIDGGGTDPPPFTMDFLLSGLNNLLINDQVASSTSDFSDYAIQTTADENGEIELRVDPQPGRTFMGLGAVAIQEVPPQPPRLLISSWMEHKRVGYGHHRHCESGSGRHLGAARRQVHRRWWPNRWTGWQLRCQIQP